jgi:hypothetical protein
MGDWKLIINGQVDFDGGNKENGERIELFNLAADIGEKKNLAQDNAAKVKELRARYDELAKQAVPPKVKPKAKDFVVPKVWGERD